MTTRVLVVDDEQEIRELLDRHLRYLGYTVHCAENGQDALEKLSAVRTDIVISDIGMPVMNGIELLGRIRSEFPMTRVVMITGFVSQENVLACMRGGAEICIFKPLEDLEVLEQAVTRATEALARWWAALGELRSLKSESPAA